MEEISIRNHRNCHTKRKWSEKQRILFCRQFMTGCKHEKQPTRVWDWAISFVSHLLWFGHLERHAKFIVIINSLHKIVTRVLFRMYLFGWKCADNGPLRRYTSVYACLRACARWREWGESERRALKILAAAIFRRKIVLAEKPSTSFSTHRTFLYPIWDDLFVSPCCLFVHVRFWFIFRVRWLVCVWADFSNPRLLIPRA